MADPFSPAIPSVLAEAAHAAALAEAHLMPTARPVHDAPKELADIIARLPSETDGRIVNQLLLQLIEIAKTIHSVRKITPLKPLLLPMRKIAADGERALRAQAFRAIRYLLTDKACLKEFFDLNLDLFTARALDRDGKYVWERTQALKIVKTIIAIDPAMMTRTLVQSIVAIAETPKDDFRHVCLDTLRELALVNAPIVASCNGLRCIVSAILNSETQDAAGSMTLTLLFLLDQDSTRKYMRAELEIERLFSVFTDFTAPNDRAKETKRAAAHKALVTIMRSWTGILCLASDRGGLRALIQILSLPTGVKGASWAKEAIFDLLFEILHVVQSQDLALAIEKDMWSRMGPNLLHNYMVMVLLALIDCGLVEALTDLTLSHDFEFSSVAQKLLMEVLRLSAEFFPREFCANLNALPGVVRYAAAFSFEAAKRFRAANVLTDLRDLNLAFRDTLQSTLLPAFAPTKAVTAKTPAASGSPAPSSSAVTEHPRLRKLHQQAEERRETGRRVHEVHGLDLELLATQTDATHSFAQVPFAAVMETAYASSVGPRAPTALASASFAQSYKQLSSPSDRLLGELRLQIESSMDDLELHALMKKSQVVNTKEYREWDWNVIIEILTGPLWSAHCLSVALSTKFCKRLLSFLRPEKAFFSALPWTVENMKYVRASCQLFRVLISHKEGAEYVHFTQLVEEILQFFTKEMNKGKEDGKDSGMSANPAMRPFSRDSTTKQLSREYFTLLGILSSSDVGLNLLDNSHLYETMYKAYEDESRDYLTRLLLANLDYGANKKARTLLEFLVKNGSMSIRKWAISHLRLLLRRNVADFWQWGVGLLLLQVQGKDIETALAALSVLEEACQANPECLVTVVKKKPVLRLIGERANNLRTTLLSTPSGVEYLSRSKCIEPLMNCWAKNGGNQKYIECLEAALVTALNTGTGFGIQNEGGENAPPSNNSSSPPAPSPSPTPAPRIVMPPLASSAPGLGNVLAIPAPSLSAPDQELDEATIAGPGFVGAFGGFGGFRGTHASCRSPADDYLFDRIHHLPWLVSLTIEIGGRSHVLNTDTFVHTVPQAGDEDGLQTFVVANLVETDGKVGPSRIDPAHTLRARLNISELPLDSKKKPKDSVCTAEQRAALAETAMGPNGAQSMTVDLVRWNFLNPAGMGRIPAEQPAPSHQRNPSRVRAQTRPETGNERAMFLESVWFQIPTVTNSMPVVSLAPHLFGELAKTEDGVRILRDSHHLRDMVQLVKSIRSSADAESNETSSASATDQRAALWALGHIGSSPLGFKLLLETGVVQLVSQQAVSCPILSMRGTCFYVLGLMTRCEAARRVLRDLGWQFSPQPDSGIIVPQSFRDFINIGSTPFVGSWATDEANKFGIDYVPLKMQAEDDPDAEANVPNNPARIILGHISNLCNNVSQKNSLTALRSFKATYPQYFASPILFAEAMKLMTAYNFKLPARRFILFDLFNQVDFSTGAVFDRPQDHTDEDALNTFNGLPFVIA